MERVERSLRSAPSGGEAFRRKETAMRVIPPCERISKVAEKAEEDDDVRLGG